jgi:hypothetical protein
MAPPAAGAPLSCTTGASCKPRPGPLGVLPPAITPKLVDAERGNERSHDDERRPGVGEGEGVSVEACGDPHKPDAQVPHAGFHGTELTASGRVRPGAGFGWAGVRASARALDVRLGFQRGAAAGRSRCRRRRRGRPARQRVREHMRAAGRVMPTEHARRRSSRSRLPPLQLLSLSESVTALPVGGFGEERTLPPNENEERSGRQFPARP